MALHGSGLRIGVHIHVEKMEILLKAEHPSLHIYGHVSNFPEHQELHLWNLDGNLLHNKNVTTRRMSWIWGKRIRTSGLWELVAADHRDVDARTVFCTVCTVGTPLWTQPKCPALSRWTARAHSGLLELELQEDDHNLVNELHHSTSTPPHPCRRHRRRDLATTCTTPSRRRPSDHQDKPWWSQRTLPSQSQNVHPVWCTFKALVEHM